MTNHERQVLILEYKDKKDQARIQGDPSFVKYHKILVELKKGKVPKNLLHTFKIKKELSLKLGTRFVS